MATACYVILRNYETERATFTKRAYSSARHNEIPTNDTCGVWDLLQNNPSRGWGAGAAILADTCSGVGGVEAHCTAPRCSGTCSKSYVSPFKCQTFVRHTPLGRLPEQRQGGLEGRKQNPVQGVCSEQGQKPRGTRSPHRQASASRSCASRARAASRPVEQSRQSKHGSLCI